MKEQEIIALLNLQTWLLTAICETHPNPKALLERFQVKIAEAFPLTEELEQVRDSCAEGFLRVLRERIV